MNINMGKVRKSLTGKCKSNESPSCPHVAFNYSSILLCPKKRKEKEVHQKGVLIGFLYIMYLSQENIPFLRKIF